MFSHLHNVHGYELLECVNTDPDHDHSDSEELDLRGSLMESDTSLLYHEDVLLIRKLAGDDAFGTVCLNENCRRKEARERDLKAIENTHNKWAKSRLQQPDSDSD